MHILFLVFYGVSWLAVLGRPRTSLASVLSGSYLDSLRVQSPRPL